MNTEEGKTQEEDDVCDTFSVARRPFKRETETGAREMNVICGFVSSFVS